MNRDGLGFVLAEYQRGCVTPAATETGRYIEWLAHELAGHFFVGRPR